MSKKSTGNYDSDTDTESVSYRECCTSPKSTLSSAKEESFAGPSGDFECSTCQSTLSSSRSSGCREIFRVEDINEEARENFQSNSMYLQKLKMHRKLLNLGEISESETSSKTKVFHSSAPQFKRFNSAPPLCNKRAITSCTLQSIQESEEEASSNFSVRTSNQNNMMEGMNVYEDKQATVEKTPRYYEVPPKKICIRDKTPEMDPVKSDELPEFSIHIGETCKNSNKRFVIGEREFILRKVNKVTTSTISTQVSQTMLVEYENCKSNVESCKPYSRSLELSDVLHVQNTEIPSQVNINLPQSVIDDADTKSINLEPNIIIIERDEDGRKKRKQRIKSIGDTSSDDYLPMKEMIDNSKDNMFSNYVRQNANVSTYIVSTNHSDSTLQTSTRKSDLALVKEPSSKHYSHTEVIRCTAEATKSQCSEMNTGKNVHEVTNIKNYKRMLTDFSSGVKPTKVFPIHFDDLETLETKDQNSVVTFKEKASEWLQLSNSRLSQTSKRSNESRISIQSISARNSGDSKNASIMDVRKSQQTDINFYLIGSSSESSMSAVSEEEIIKSPCVSPSKIQVDSDEDNPCCSCFGSLRLL